MRTLVLWGLLLTAAGVTAYDWSFRVEGPTRQARLDGHRGIVTRVTWAPERYRVLVPYSLDPMIRLASRWMPYEKAFGRVYAVFYLLSIAWMFVALHRYLREFFTLEQALVGVLAAASTLPMTLRYYDYSPYSLLEPSFFAIALVWIRQQRFASLAALLLIATLNRETAIFIIFLYFVTVPLDRRHIQIGVGYLAIWATVFYAVRWYAGEARRYFDLETTWHGNTHSVEQLVIAASSWVLLLGALWIYAAMGVSRAPWFVRRTALVFPVYLVTILVWGMWLEVRLLLPMYPVLLPLALSYLFEARRD
jgi:hypothetical protein